MDAVATSEAKTKFSEICERVATKGVAVVVRRRGKPLVTIEPIAVPEGKLSSVWGRRAEFEKRHGRLTEDFTLPPREQRERRNFPLQPLPW